MARQHFNDLGLSGRASESRVRFLNRDGSFNVHRSGVPLVSSLSFYHFLLELTWTRFCLLLFTWFILANALFAYVYFLVGTQSIVGIEASSNFELYLQDFFLSAQTLTTVGFGHLAPTGIAGNAVATIESVLGLMALAVVTGVIYGRFSRPVAKIIFSKEAVVAPYQGGTGFMFRLANARRSQITNVSVKVILVRKEVNPDGTTKRGFYPLELERNSIDFFTMSWTVVHPIDETSPLYGQKKEELDTSEAEFLIILSGFEESFSQTVLTRTSYRFHEVQFGKRFTSIISIADDGIPAVDIGKLHEIESPIK